MKDLADMREYLTHISDVPDLSFIKTPSFSAMDGDEHTLSTLIQSRLMSKYVDVLEKAENARFTEGIQCGRDAIGKQYKELTKRDWDGDLVKFNSAIGRVGTQYDNVAEGWDWKTVLKTINNYDGKTKGLDGNVYGFRHNPIEGIRTISYGGKFGLALMTSREIIGKSLRDGKWDEDRNNFMNLSLQLTCESSIEGYPPDIPTNRKDFDEGIKAIQESHQDIEGFYLHPSTVEDINKYYPDISLDGIPVKGPKLRELPKGWEQWNRDSHFEEDFDFGY